VGPGVIRTIARTCVWLGIASTVSLFAALLVMTLVVDAPAVAEWFLVSAVLAGVNFLVAVVASFWTE
jgi:hypothetical protein